MNKEQSNILYILGKVQRNIIESFVEQNKEPEYIIRELQRIGLNPKTDNADWVESYVRSYLWQHWNTDFKEWQVTLLTDYENDISNFKEKDLFKCLSFELDKNDYKTFIKDIMSVVSGLREVTTKLNNVAAEFCNIMGTIKLVNMKEEYEFRPEDEIKDEE